jgi:hypothetical protein
MSGRFPYSALRVVVLALKRAVDLQATASSGPLERRAAALAARRIGVAGAITGLLRVALVPFAAVALSGIRRDELAAAERTDGAVVRLFFIFVAH